MKVAFVNENTLGHASYLLPFVRWFAARPELGITPLRIDATPLPPALARGADFSVPGLRRGGLDFHNARWRLAVSRHVRDQVDALRAREPLGAVVVNTQSVGLHLAELGRELPLFVCLDATFQQLARSRWFAPNAPTRWFLPLTLAPLRAPERALFQAAARLLPWSAAAAGSLARDYQVPPGRMLPLPPSVEAGPEPPARPARSGRPQLLFVGGDFNRKGGPLLLECHRRHFADRCDLHVVTHDDVPAGPGVVVHRGLQAHTPAWRERWAQADLLVFPSTLETFGIVLLEALAFGVPVVASEVGAAREVLGANEAGWVVPPGDEAALAAAVREALDDPDLARRKAAAGWRRVQEQYQLASNAARLAAALHAVAKQP